MTAEAILKAVGGQESGATWMTRCPGHEGLSPTVRPQRWGSRRQTLVDLGVAPIVGTTGDRKSDGVAPMRTV